MPCPDCGGTTNAFSGLEYIHLKGCPRRGSKFNRKEAEEKVKRGRQYAFKDIFLPDPSERLGKELEEKDRVKRHLF